MPTPDPVSDRRLGVAALLAAVAVTAIYSGVYTGVLLLGPAEVVLPLDGGAVAVAAMVLETWLTAVVWYVPYLLVVLRFVAEPSRENAVSGAIIIYAVGLLFAWLPTLTVGAETTMATAVLPLGDVATYLAVVTAVWLAYHGGVERLAEAIGDPPEHPVTALGAETRLTPDLTAQRGLLAAVAGALVSAGGQLLTGVLYGQIRSAAAGSNGVVLTSGTPSPEQVPAVLAFQTAFLLAVLLVTGPRLGRRSVLQGAGFVVVGQVAVMLLWTLVVPDRQLLPPGSQLLRPLAAVTTLVAIAAAVWLAFHDGIERVRG